MSTFKNNMVRCRDLFCILILTLSGCTAPLIGNAPTYPDRPDQLNGTTVVEYVEDYEKAERYREFDTNEAVEFECRSEILEEVESGYYLQTVCLVSQGLFEAQAASVTYYVNESVTLRIHPAWRRPSQPGDPRELESGGVHVYNFSPSETSISLELSYADASPPEQVFVNSSSMRSKTGMRYLFRSLRKGNYTLNATVANETHRYEWQVRERTSTNSNWVGILVTPSGDVRFVSMSRLLET